MTRGLTLLFAIGGGLAVGNLYYAQPLLDLIARQLSVRSGSVGLLVTATQLGYALGIFLIVPLGDLKDRRRLVPLMMVLSAVALAGCALSPSLPLLLAASVALGVTTVAGQILSPLAGDLAEPGRRGRVVGVVASGLITGIIVSRTVSGLVGGLLGWRVIFALAAVVVLVFAAVLARRIPRLPPKTDIRYGRLLGSVLGLVATERPLQVSMLLGALAFAVFTMFWTSLTFLLSAPPYSLPAAAIGLFGLAGLLGTLAAQGAGRLHDRGVSVPATGIAWLLVLVAWVVALLGSTVLAVVVGAVVVLDVGIQAQSILNQNRIYALPAEARSRRNTAYVTGNFLGGAAGSLAASLLWQLGRWPAVAVVGGLLTLVALGVWAVTRRSALVLR
jgi:predicted MFS family arabinose efflux permease